MAVSSRKPRRRVSSKSAQRKSAQRKSAQRKSAQRKSAQRKSSKSKSSKSKSARSSRKVRSRKSSKSPSRRLAVDEFYCVACRKKVKGENIKLVYLDNAKRGKVPALKATCEINGRRNKLIKFVALADVPKLKQMF